MPYKISFLYNRADQEGFSDTWYTNSTASFAAVFGQAGAYAAARANINGTQVYLYGVRVSQYPGSNRNSQFFLNTSNNLGLSAASGPGNVDQGGNGALVSLIGTNGGRQVRLFRGIPDAWMYWDTGLGRMNISSTGVQSLNTFLTLITANSLGFGWFKRSVAVKGTNAFPVTTVAAGLPGTVIITAPGTAFVNPGAGPLILSGFKRPCSVLNGSYGTGEWTPGVGAGVYILTRVVSLDAISAYAGVGGLVRPTGAVFNPLAPTSVGLWGLVRNRRVGRPFGTVRGRRLVPR